MESEGLYEAEEELVYLHQKCGYPIVQDPDGNWVHASVADGAFCSFLPEVTR